MDTRTATIESLIRETIPKHENQTLDDYEKFVQTQLKVMLKNSTYQDSNPTNPTIESGKVGDLIKRELMKQNKVQSAMRVSQLLANLNNSTTKQTDNQLLYILLQLLKNPSPQQVNQDLMNLETTSAPQREIIIDGPSILAPINSNIWLEYQKYLASKKYISEQEMIKDLLYTFQGIDGKYIIFDKIKQNYVFHDKVMIQSNFSGLVQQHCELGVLTKQIKEFTEKNLTAPSLVLQSFCYFVKTELSTYYKLISVLESQNQTTPLTMKRISVWIMDPLERMRLLASIIKDTKNLKGGEFITKVYEFTRTGNSVNKFFVNDIIKSISKPLFNIIYKWICFGEILDPFEEFFILSNHKVKDLWREKYSIRSNMIPQVISMELVKKIHLVGKSINFIHTNCKNLTWEIDSTIISLPFDTIENLEVIVGKALLNVNQSILDLIMNKFGFMNHFHVIHDYLLLGNGSFIVGMIESLGFYLNKNSTSVNKNGLVESLEASIKSLQIDNDDINKTLGMKFEPKTGVVGWNAFTLSYSPPMPLDTIFTNACIEDLIKMFKFLWSIKRVESLLSASWKISVAPGVSSLLHLTRNEMNHFLINFQYYLFYDVIKERSIGFEHEVKKLMQDNGNFDDILKLFDEFRTHLIKETLTEVSDDLKKILQQILTSMNSFVELVSLISRDTDGNVDGHQKSLVKVRNEFHLAIKLLMHKFDESKNAANFQMLKFRLDYTNFFTK